MLIYKLSVKRDSLAEKKDPYRHFHFCFWILFLKEFFFSGFWIFVDSWPMLYALFCDSFATCRSAEICGLWEHSPNFVSSREIVLCCNERDSMRCRKGLTYSTLSSFYLYLSEVWFNLFLCGPEKFKNYGQFYETDITSEMLDKVTGKYL